jgi:hypothetical protein
MSRHILRRKGAPDFTRVCSSPVTLQAYHKNDGRPEVIINAARRASNAYAGARRQSVRQPRSDLNDMGLLTTFHTPGIRQQRRRAKPVGDGICEIDFVPPRSGGYYIFFQCPSPGVAYRQIPHLILNAEAAAKGGQ